MQAFDSDGKCSVAMVSSAPLRIHSLGATETRVQIASEEREVFVATPQRETACDGIEKALSLSFVVMEMCVFEVRMFLLWLGIMVLRARMFCF